MPQPIDHLSAALAGRYRLDRELGAGGMATVYLAEDLKHHRPVAIKVLKPDLVAAMGAERFQREIGIAARLSHPHILGLHDSGEASGFLYYVMPLVEGTSLREKLVREGELPIPEAVRILRDIADAMAHAHGKGVVHRDIKPENVMLTGRHALVMDFGVAKAVAAGRDGAGAMQTSVGVALGTPAYMAPEQASADPHVDHRADLYAWGIVAYELLAGQPPFVRSSHDKVLVAQVSVKPEPLSAHRANVPAALEQLIMRCLEKRPADRPQSAEEILRSLESVLTPSGGLTPTDTRPFQTAGMRRARRRVLLIGIAAVAGLAVVGALGWSWWQSRGVPIVADRVVIAPFRNESGRAEFADLGWRLAEEIGGVVRRKGVADPMSAGATRELVGNGAAPMGSELTQLARQTGAGLVVSGNYRSRGDSVEIRAEILRMPSGTKVYEVTPVVGLPGDASVLDRVAERAAIGLLLLKDYGDAYGWGRDHRPPGSLEAYRLLFAERGNENLNSICRKVLTLDPEWPFALTRCFRDSALSDSLGKVLRERYQSLLPGDLNLAQYYFATQANDREAAYQAAAARLKVDSVSWVGHAAAQAYYTSRFNEVVRLGDRRHIPSCCRDQSLYYFLSAALHALGRFEEALAVAQEIRRDFPNVPWTALTAEIEARAALGQVAEVERLVAEGEGMRRPVGGTTTRANIASSELLFHGHPEAARRVAERGLVWVKRQVADHPGDADWLWEYSMNLAQAGRHEESLVVARQRLDALRANRGDTLSGLSSVARTEAALGHPDRAVALSRQLSAAGRHRAAIALYTALGDTLATMETFRILWDQGVFPYREYHIYHREPPGILLRDYPAFRELTRVRD